MAFHTDRNWPRDLLKIFEINHDLKKYVSRSLRYFIPLHIRHWQFLRFLFSPGRRAPRNTIDFVIHRHTGNKRARPVFFVEIKDDAKMEFPKSRWHVDDQQGVS